MQGQRDRGGLIAGFAPEANSIRFQHYTDTIFGFLTTWREVSSVKSTTVERGALRANVPRARLETGHLV